MWQHQTRSQTRGIKVSECNVTCGGGRKQSVAVAGPGSQTALTLQMFNITSYKGKCRLTNKQNLPLYELKKAPPHQAVV